MQNFIEINLFGKFGSPHVISILHQTQNSGSTTHVYYYSNQLEPSHAYRIKQVLNSQNNFSNENEYKHA